MYRCDNAGENGITRLARVRCPTGLYFDVYRQTCDWKTNVKNCDELGSKSTTVDRPSMEPVSVPSSVPGPPEQTVTTKTFLSLSLFASTCLLET